MQYSAKKPNGYIELCNDKFVYNGNLTAAAVDVLVTKGLSQDVNSALNNAVQRALSDPKKAKALQSAKSLIYTTSPPQTMKNAKLGSVIVIPYKIWYK